jgi:hypothetical protein
MKGSKKLLGFDSYDRVITYHKRWVENYLGNGKNIRDEKWTRSIAVGSKGFVDRVKSTLGVLAFLDTFCYTVLCSFKQGCYLKLGSLNLNYSFYHNKSALEIIIFSISLVPSYISIIFASR